MRVAIITAKAPWGATETFVLQEILELHHQGCGVIVLPLRPEAELPGGTEALAVSRYTVRIPLVSLSVLVQALRVTLVYPGRALKCAWSVLRWSGNWRKLLKNAAVVPKALVLSDEIRRHRIEHIHAHWASTPSTAAYIAALVTGIPWSLTAHRWDIDDANMLYEKVRTARFVRAISERGAREIRRRLPTDELRGRVQVLHLGVAIPHVRSADREDTRGAWRIACVGHLIPVKGHCYLIQACSELRKRGVSLRCDIIGEGPLKLRLRRQAKELGLEDDIVFRGFMPHDRLLAMYVEGGVDLVVHPSIQTTAGEAEGIPVALLEAMAASIPVVSTATGAIPELLGDGAGLLVPPMDPSALAAAIELLLKDRRKRVVLGRSGRRRVAEAFSARATVRRLIRMIEDEGSSGVSALSRPGHER